MCCAGAFVFDVLVALSVLCWCLYVCCVSGAFVFAVLVPLCLCCASALVCAMLVVRRVLCL